MRPYLSGEDDFSELTDISSSVFCLISGKIRKRSPPTPPALAFRRSRFPAPFCPPEARDAALCEAAQPRSEGRARAHDRARRAEPSPSGGRRSAPERARAPRGPRHRCRRQGGRGGGLPRGKTPKQRIPDTDRLPGYLAKRNCTPAKAYRSKALKNMALRIIFVTKSEVLNHYFHTRVRNQTWKTLGTPGFRF